ncbi:hypothetical protein PFISCL1PPCAC_8742, partial [Pristionchus fissidentatus]
SAQEPAMDEAQADADCGMCSLAMWGIGAAIVLFLLRKWIKGGQFTERVSAKGKVAAVTGANTGLGLETVRELNLRGAKVYMLCRNEERANEAKIKLVRMGCDATRLIFEQCDLSKFASVRACAKRISQAEPHLDILINNAGIMFYPKHELTEDKHEMTWQSNHLGPFLLTELLLPLVEKAEEGRIVNVSSMLHEKSAALELDTIDDKKQFGRLAPYNRSKLANVMHARELSRRIRARGNNTVTVNSLHPGACASDLSRHLFLGRKPFTTIAAFFMKTERDGAQTSLFLALSKKVKGVSGCYFADCARKSESTVALDDLACKQLYDYSRKAVGIE